MKVSVFHRDADGKLVRYESDDNHVNAIGWVEYDLKLAKTPYRGPILALIQNGGGSSC